MEDGPVIFNLQDLINQKFTTLMICLEQLLRKQILIIIEVVTFNQVVLTNPKYMTLMIFLELQLKKTNINNNRSGNFQSTGPYKPKVYDPNDLPRTTIKETNIDNNRSGNFQSTGPYKTPVYDPNDLPRTTIKETNIDNNRSGNFQSTGPYKTPVYDPNDLPRTTIKETNINNNRSGNFQSTGPAKTPVYNPNDVPRTTLKETSINNNRAGNFQTNGPYKQTIYDPNDLARTTVKETTILENNMGNVERQNKNTAYMNKQKTINPKITNRQNTSVQYMGDAKGRTKGGYQISKVKAKNTSRQFLADNEYTGTQGPATTKAPRTYTDIRNATTRSVREKIARGRTPANQGPKKGISSKNINMTTTKHGEFNNKNLEERGVMSTKVYNSLPQKNQFGQTEQKKQLPNKPIASRLDPNILDPFKDNPYTQSLHSFAFN